MNNIGGMPEFNRRARIPPVKITPLCKYVHERAIQTLIYNINVLGEQHCFPILIDSTIAIAVKSQRCEYR